MKQAKPNLIRVHIIKCLECYDLGQRIDPFDHGKRRPCPCRAGDPLRRWPCPRLAEIKTEGAKIK